MQTEYQFTYTQEETSLQRDTTNATPPGVALPYNHEQDQYVPHQHQQLAASPPMHTYDPHGHFQQVYQGPPLQPHGEPDMVFYNHQGQLVPQSQPPHYPAPPMQPHGEPDMVFYNHQGPLYPQSQPPNYLAQHQFGSDYDNRMLKVAEEKARNLEKQVEELEAKLSGRNFNNDKDEKIRKLEGELGQTKEELGQTKEELGQTKEELGQTKAKIGQMEEELSEKTERLDKLKDRQLVVSLGKRMEKFVRRKVKQRRKHEVSDLKGYDFFKWIHDNPEEVTLNRNERKYLTNLFNCAVEDNIHDENREGHPVTELNDPNTFNYHLGRILGNCIPGANNLAMTLFYNDMTNEIAKEQRQQARKVARHLNFRRRNFRRRNNS